MENSQFTASNFDVTIFRANGSLNFEVSAISTLNGYYDAHVTIIAYGISIISEKLSLCELSPQQLCPMTPGHFDVPLSSQTLSESVIGQIPSIAFQIPDLDGVVRVSVYPQGQNSSTASPVACVEATLSNGKTVSTKYVAWPIAAITFAGLLVSSIVWLFGHISTSAHIASNIVSLFVYFQGLAIISMMAVDRLPPMAAAWAQNYMWTVGLISIPFMQNIFNWYVQATGGTVTDILPNAAVMSISVQRFKRSLTAALDFSGILQTYFTPNPKLTASPYSLTYELVHSLGYSAPAQLVKRATNSTIAPAETTNEALDDYSATTLVLRGIQRVAYLANIEITSLFMTGLIFFLILCVFTVIIFVLAKIVLELLVKAGAVQPTSFIEYRKDWRTVIKGVFYRLALLSFPQLTVLCLWELTKHDSPAIVILAVLTYIIIVALLGFGAYKTISLARQSMTLHKNPAYILYSDRDILNRWGFLYVQFRASAYFFIVPLIIYIFVKGLFIAFGQNAGKVQGVLVFVTELIYLVIISYFKPYMDKSTNGFNIAISAINFINALFFLFFSAIFGLPLYVAGIMGVVFFILNAVFSLVLLIMVIVSCVWALFSKNPENRYQPMRDDRESFIPNNGGDKSAATELDALGMSARDGHETTYPINDDEESIIEQAKSRLSSRNDVNSMLPNERLTRNNGYALNNGSSRTLLNPADSSSNFSVVVGQEYKGNWQSKNNF
jgi:hypothetical protein